MCKFKGNSSKNVNNHVAAPLPSRNPHSPINYAQPKVLVVATLHITPFHDSLLSASLPSQISMPKYYFHPPSPLTRRNSAKLIQPHPFPALIPLLRRLSASHPPNRTPLTRPIHASPPTTNISSSTQSPRSISQPQLQTAHNSPIPPMLA